MSTAPAAERLYRDSLDPRGYRASDYEHAKYATTLEVLPKPSHRLCLEVGCSIGVFTALLAARCEHVVAIDSSLGAIGLAHQNLAGVRNVDLLRASFPEDTPPGSWDLIVCSEILYYLQPPALGEAIAWMEAQLGYGASVVVVSWRDVGRDGPLTGDEVHDRLTRDLSVWHALDARTDEYRLDRFDSR